MMGDTLTVVFTWAKWMVTKLNRKSLRAQREVGSPQCARKESGSRVSRPQCPSVCHQFTLLLGHMWNDHLNCSVVHRTCVNSTHTISILSGCETVLPSSATDSSSCETLASCIQRFCMSTCFALPGPLAVDQAHRCWGIQVQIQSVLRHALDPEPFWGRLDCSKKAHFRPTTASPPAVSWSTLWDSSFSSWWLQLRPTVEWFCRLPSQHPSGPPGHHSVARGTNTSLLPTRFLPILLTHSMSRIDGFAIAQYANLRSGRSCDR